MTLVPFRQEASLSIRLMPLRPIDIDTAANLALEANEWAPRTQLIADGRAILGQPDSLWFSALNGDELIGTVGYHSINWIDGCAEVALGVVPKWRGKGVGTIISKLLVGNAFDDLGLRRLTATTLVGGPSDKLCPLQGGILEGIHKGVRRKSGRFYDSHTYALTKEG